VSYPTHIAATLSGASVRQLTYWRRPGTDELLTPELGRVAGQWRYSFRDVVALRTFAFIREQVSLQRIRKAVHELRDLGNLDHLSKYRLEVAGESIVWMDPRGEFVDLVEQPGAVRISVVLDEVFGPFTNLQGAEVVDLRRPRAHIEVDPETQGGYPVIRGTRIEFDLVSSLVADGMAVEDVASVYPPVTAAAAADALDFADEVERYRVGDVAQVP
jgi:uncharacterized protein (DUF433 family)/DNA-binding transcriptional MerR regulator